VNQDAWSPEEKAEWEAALELAVTTTEDDTRTQMANSARAADMLARIVADAVQAHRPWAFDVQRTALHDGLNKMVKEWRKKIRIVGADDDEKTVDRPGVIGVVRAGEDGEKWVQQVLIQTATFDELRAKRKEYAKQVAAFKDNIFIVDKLLRLQAMCPVAATPQEACDLLGIDLGEYMVAKAA
jgi:hypothetical protein